MIRDQIADIVKKTVAALQEHGELPATDIPAVEIERPQIAAHGDYATNIAMKLAAAVSKASGQKTNPHALAQTIADHIQETVDLVPAYSLLRKVEVAGPGFINFWLNPQWLLDQAPEVIAAGNAFGAIQLGTGKRINLEFVSANPTGPVTVGNGRGAFIGDTLGNVLRAAGYDVTKEYYFNDAGGQIVKLGRSMEHYLWHALGDAARAQAVYDALPEAAPKKKKVYGSKAEQTAQAAPTEQAEAEETEEAAEAETDDLHDESETRSARKEGYFGPYYLTVAERIIADGGRKLLDLPEEERAATIGRAAAMQIMADIKQTMAKLHVDFDVWFNQADLESSGALEESIEVLRGLGFIHEEDGATWANTTQFGDDLDRVVVRSNGAPTYFASDVAYMRNKFERGFDRLIFVLGPDHHGYIARLKAIAGVLGRSLDDVHVLMYQQVNLKQDGKVVKMGKRLGTVVTLDELYDDIGADVTRFFYLMRANDTPLDFDLNLARQQGEENPGLSVQYAHARASGVFRKAREQGITEEQYGGAKVDVLANDPEGEVEYELALVRQLLRLEEVIERIALTLEPHHLTRYGMDLADAFHLFYDHCPILKQGTEISQEVRMARLRLMRAAQAGLARVLTLLTMDAPERMERAE